MYGDQLDVALILPEISVLSGGVERCMKLIEHSDSASIAYTAFVTVGGIHNREVVERLRSLERSGLLTLNLLSPRRANAFHQSFDAVVIPSEYWMGASKRARFVGITAPSFVEFMQLPYLGTLDILRANGISSPTQLDLVRVPFVSSKLLGDNLLLSAFQTVASALQIRSASKLQNGRVMGLTPVVARNLAALGFSGSLYVPDCPCGIERDTVRQSMSQGDSPVFDGVYVGRFHPQKGFLDLPIIVAHLKKLLARDVSVAVCGGSQFPRHSRAFRNLVKSLGVERNITMLGRISRSELYSTMRKSKMLIYPSYVDSFSITVLESLCLGLPVVAYAIDALETIWAGKRGVFLAEVGNPKALAELCSDIERDSRLESEREAMRDQSASLMEEYTWEKAVLDERKFYEGDQAEFESIA